MILSFLIPPLLNIFKNPFLLCSPLDSPLEKMVRKPSSEAVNAKHPSSFENTPLICELVFRNPPAYLHSNSLSFILYTLILESLEDTNNLSSPSADVMTSKPDILLPLLFLPLRLQTVIWEWYWRPRVQSKNKHCAILVPHIATFPEGLKATAVIKPSGPNSCQERTLRDSMDHNLNRRSNDPDRNNRSSLGCTAMLVTKSTCLNTAKHSSLLGCHNLTVLSIEAESK